MNCTQCNTAIRPRQDKTICINCSDKFHRTCTEIKQAAYRKAKGDLQWLCVTCRDVSIIILFLLPI